MFSIKHIEENILTVLWQSMVVCWCQMVILYMKYRTETFDYHNNIQWNLHYITMLLYIIMLASKNMEI